MDRARRLARTWSTGAEARYTSAVDTRDEFEREAMNAPGEVLLRDKLPSRKMAALLALSALAVAGLMVGVSVAQGVAAPLIGLIGPVMMLAAALTTTVVRTVVTSEEVVVRLGLWGPRVAVGEILEARVIAYPFFKYGGWGIRRALDGSRAYTMVGGTDQVVELRYRDGGRERTVVFSAGNPSAVVAAIERARTQSGGELATRARVALDTEPERAQELGLEVEAGRELEG